MKPYEIYALTAVLLFCIGLHGVIYHRHLVRKIMAMNLMGGGVFLLFVSIARRNSDIWADPVPQAMVLTGIVVAISASALGLVLASRIHQETGQISLEENEEKKS